MGIYGYFLKKLDI